MSDFRSDFMQVMTERGFVHQVSDADGLDQAAHEGRVIAYVGYDCTGPSLHVGHLLSIMMLHWLQQTGGKPITLMGGGTTRVGDPSGKDEERPILSLEQIDANKRSIQGVFSRFLRFGDNSGDAIMVDNAEWLGSLNYVDFLRDVGRHFSVNRMLTFDSVKIRLERHQELSFLAFNYMILQAYDFVELNRRYGCILQMGGSDQWGNIVNGIDLARRMHGAQLYALTTPLLTTASGAKMGKTAAGGSIWLNTDMMSPYDYWQYWRNAEDGDVSRFLKLFTLLPMDEIARLGQLQGQEINEAKKVLATEATALVHGREAALEAAETARQTFEQGQIAETLPTVSIPASELEQGVGVQKLLVTAALAKSNSEVRRAIANNSVAVNDARVTDDRRLVTREDLTPEGVVKLSMGRKRHVLVKPV